MRLEVGRSYVTNDGSTLLCTGARTTTPYTVYCRITHSSGVTTFVNDAYWYVGNGALGGATLAHALSVVRAAVPQDVQYSHLYVDKVMA